MDVVILAFFLVGEWFFLRAITLRRAVVPSLQNSNKPSRNLWEDTLLRRTLSVQRFKLARSFITNRQTNSVQLVYYTDIFSLLSSFVLQQTDKKQLILLGMLHAPNSSQQTQDAPSRAGTNPRSRPPLIWLSLDPRTGSFSQICQRYYLLLMCWL